MSFCPSITQAQSPNPTKSAFGGPQKPVVTTRILFVFDASGSMFEKLQNNTRINVAKKLLAEMVDTLKKQANTQIALRVYGHRSERGEKNCKDSHLEVPFFANNHEKIKEKIKGIVPKGTTPIAYSLQMSGDDFPADPLSRNILILITDGLESCDGDPCAVSLALQKRHVVLKPFIIGIGLTPAVKDAFECMGTFYPAEQEEGLRRALKLVVDQAVNKTTFQISLLDSIGRASETNLPFTLYDKTLGIDRYSYIHTLNSKGLPDTLVVDPVHTYNITVHSNPPVNASNITLIPGKHNTFSVKTPTGQLEILMGGNAGNYLRADVRKSGSCETVLDHDINTRQRYIIGNYDIDIPSLPPLKFRNVRISQSKTTRIQLPQLGMLNLTVFGDGFGSIMKTENGKLVKVYDLNLGSRGETVYLIPGEYRILFRSKAANSSLFTVDKPFTIKSGETLNIKL